MIGAFSLPGRAEVRSAVAGALPHGIVGLVVAQLHLALPSSAEPHLALAAGVKWAVLSWIVSEALAVAIMLARPVLGPKRPGEADAGRGTLLRIVGVGAIIIAAALLRSPGRLVLNLLGFAMVTVTVCWTVQRRAGWGASARAASIVVVLAFFPTHLDYPTPPLKVRVLPDNPFNWSTGWPSGEWVLRHRVELDAPWPEKGASITFIGDREYIGPAAILARVNERDLGPMRREVSGHAIIELPADVARGQRMFVIELRTSISDPALRLTAQRWTGGATAGSGASSYFDGERWHTGTFNDALGSPKPGVYVMLLGPL